MIEIIDGKRYDTETAALIATHHSSERRSDLDFFEETLYRTGKGAWFIHGSGGARSPYGRQADGSWWSPGAEIRPITSDEARHWLERRRMPELVEEHFPHCVEDA